MKWWRWSLALAVVLALAMMGWMLLRGPGTQKPLRPVGAFALKTFRKGDYDLDYYVPAGVIWKLTWWSPYPGEAIVPSYDVRVTGQAYIGEKGEVLATTLSITNQEGGLVDLMAAGGKATVWLYPGTHFLLAHEDIDVFVEVYLDEWKLP